MQESEKIDLVKAMTDETDEGTIAAYLALAGSKICRRAYPFDPTVTDVPTQYDFLQAEIAAYLISRKGSIGAISHSENGYSETYESSDVPESMLSAVIPMVGVL